MRSYYVYILTNKSNTLYTGITNNLERRLLEHEFRLHKGSFAAKYNINKLIYYQEFSDPEEAIAAETAAKTETPVVEELPTEAEAVAEAEPVPAEQQAA